MTNNMQHLWVSAKTPPEREGKYYVLTERPVPHMERASFIFDMWVNNDNVVITITAYDKNRIEE